MKHINLTAAMILPILMLAGCGSSAPDIADAFPNLERGQMEVRMGQTPGLEKTKCNRNMYAGFRSENGEPVTVTIDLSASGTGTSLQRHTRELVLETTSRDDMVVGQTPLFPETLDAPCNAIHVKMSTIKCAFGPNKERGTCPSNVKWQWLQGFKMIEVPTRS